MLELATLGTLLREPLHGYRLKQQLELFMSSCITVNYGSIYPLLKRLEERGELAAVSEEEATEGCRELSTHNMGSTTLLVKPARTSKIYSITDSGRSRWRQKMLEHPQESWIHSRSRFLIKFFFFSYLTPEERIKLLEHRLMVGKLRLETPEPEIVAGDQYQTTLWHYACQVLQGEIEWVIEQLAFERKEVSLHNLKK